jgi:hypothetical protein
MGGHIGIFTCSSRAWLGCINRYHGFPFQLRSERRSSKARDLVPSSLLRYRAGCSFAHLHLPHYSDLYPAVEIHFNLIVAPHSQECHSFLRLPSYSSGRGLHLRQLNQSWHSSRVYSTCEAHARLGLYPGVLETVEESRMIDTVVRSWPLRD